jgi:hypothetical protein
MTKEQAATAGWGKPNKVVKTTTAQGMVEEWFYLEETYSADSKFLGRKQYTVRSPTGYIYTFTNGVLAKITESKR